MPHCNTIYDDTWRYWVVSGTGTSAATTDGWYGTSLDTTWRTWVTTSTATTATYYADATSTLSNVWTQWNNQTAAPSIRYRTYTPAPAPPPETEEQRTARLEREVALARERAERAEAAAQAAKLAEATAEKLLLAHLTRHQRRTYRTRQCFNVRGASGRKYRITRGWSGNVKLLTTNHKPEANYCIHPYETVPIPDNMLAQKLLLEADEPAFLRIANKTAIRA